MRTGKANGWRILTALLCLSLFGFSLLSAFSLVPRGTEISVQQSQEASDHGHYHGFQEDLFRIMHGHDHAVIDHDHNPALGAVTLSGITWNPEGDFWRPKGTQDSANRAFPIERPPRA